MRKSLMKIVGVLALATWIGASFAASSEAAMNRKKRQYLKHVPPLGWQYQAGYTLWRLERGLSVTPQTWRKYVREKKWARKNGQETLADRLLLKSLDWTAEELAALLEGLEDTSVFHPAGVEP